MFSNFYEKITFFALENAVYKRLLSFPVRPPASEETAWAVSVGWQGFLLPVLDLYHASTLIRGDMIIKVT